MAVLQPQVCANALKFQPTEAKRWNRSGDVKAREFKGLRSLFNGKLVRKGRGRRIGVNAKAKETGTDLYGESVADDYYSVLGVTPNAMPAEIRKAYYNCMKACHPDLSGNDNETTNFCMFVNEVYEILSDPVQRKVYDEINGYSLRTVNPFLDDSQPRDHVFVDEFTCIGCKNCASIAPDIFNIEEDFGRARAVCQSGNPDFVQQAIDSCPVDCIHWTTAAQLSLLEDEMRRMERVNVGVMLSNMGFTTPDVFSKANSRWEKRQARVLERARIRMMKEKRASKTQSYWDGVWGGDGSYQSTGHNNVREQASRAAAAARKWREYSRKGVDRRPTGSLPGKKSVEEEKEVQNV
uniref:J domain-containing protein n=1 Tax=Araucaria cunninghamii TaxID=56994 RepID=A0A0D6R8N4_ARACU